ncbi:hypothetical protein LX97_03020 [Nonlabens dokdonensis]|uniref:Uncharacterized protein n=2 Tax=Nonlabens dokdonensis TaxID=328515 RepID=L7WGV6_NONDD|nr:hypothetical protein [Nonlabens dokdonensis]AGC78183.1 hypothetical protein DDD_3056 [Nonlabens dokdonensis DSW-6]PZX37924.1 hypothetical protein LX97_03020 [Nonlabens dokdonensis]
MFQSKRSKLIAGILLDLIGIGSYLIPIFGEITDLGWAPIAGFIMTKLYPGKSGVAAGVLTTIEELMPGMDIIPSFTIMWCYTYLINPSEENNKGKTVIDVDHR